MILKSKVRRGFNLLSNLALKTCQKLHFFKVMFSTKKNIIKWEKVKNRVNGVTIQDGPY